MASSEPGLRTTPLARASLPALISIWTLSLSYIVTVSTRAVLTCACTARELSSRVRVLPGN